MQNITSRENPAVKRFAGLASDKDERNKSESFAIEGVRLCFDAFASGIAFREVFVTEKALNKHSKLQDIVEKANESYIISDSVATKLADTKTPQGVFAICEKPHNQRQNMHSTNARYLLLASLQDSGNVGTIIRTAEALGLDGVAMTSDCPDLWSPKVLRASMGGAFRMRVWTVNDMKVELGALKSEGVTVYAAALKQDAKKLGTMRFDGACAVLLGNEGAGLSCELIEACDDSVVIPMRGRADSLGVAMAAGIVAWEMKA